MASITVLGGGISGITTGTLLTCLGHSVQIVTEHRVDRLMGSHNPVIASLYPAASVIPHTVTVDDPVRHLRDTQAFFEVVRRAGDFGVRQQRHFEVFEAPTSDPEYAPALLAFERIADAPATTWSPPHRPRADRTYGWTFRMYFAETPVYIPRLYHLFESLGGAVMQEHVTRDRLPTLPGDALVDCLGSGSGQLFNDPRDAEHLRGVLVYADLLTANGVHIDSLVGDNLSSERHDPFPTSYNYTPDAAVYATARGSAAGVYAYPRSDVWVLGGTKQKGRLDDTGRWHGEPIAGETIALPQVDGTGSIEVPRPVLSLNRDLLADWTGIDITHGRLRATFGYRYARDLDGEGVRMGLRESPDGRPLVHNTGHGGAGVTLSWSCALRVASALADAGLPPPRRQPSPSRPTLEQPGNPSAPANEDPGHDASTADLARALAHVARSRM